MPPASWTPRWRSHRWCPPPPMWTPSSSSWEAVGGTRTRQRWCCPPHPNLRRSAWRHPSRGCHSWPPRHSSAPCPALTWTSSSCGSRWTVGHPFFPDPFAREWGSLAKHFLPIHLCFRRLWARRPAVAQIILPPAKSTSYSNPKSSVDVPEKLLPNQRQKWSKILDQELLCQ